MNRRAFLRGLITAAGSFGLAACGLLPSPTPSATPPPSPSPSPSRTPSPSPTPTRTPSPTPTNTPTPTATPTPVLAGTALPGPSGSLTELTLPQVSELARWGRGTIHGLAWSPDGSRLAAATDLGLYLYESEHLLLETVLDSGPVRHAAFLPDGQRLVSAGGSLTVWDLPPADASPTLREPGLAPVAAMTCTPDGAAAGLIVQEVGRSAQFLRLDLASSAPAARVELAGAAAPLAAAALSPDLKWTALRFGDGRVGVWSTAGPHQVDLPPDLQKPGPLAFNPDGSSLAVGYPDTSQNFENSNLVRIFALPAAAPRIDLFPDGGVEGASEALLSIAYSPDGSHIAAGYANGAVRVWRSSGGPPERKLAGPGVPVQLAFSPASTHIAGGGLTLWDLADGSLTAAQIEHFAPVSDLALTPGGDTAAIAFQGRIELRHVDSGSTRLTIASIPAPTTGLSFSPDGVLLCAACADGTARLWRVSDGSYLTLIGSPTRPQWATAFSPDGKRILFGGENGQIQIYDVEKKLVIGRVLEPFVTTRLAYLPDGARYASLTSAGLTLRLLNGDLDRVIAGTGLEDMAFSPDGALVALAGNEILRMVDTASGQLVYSFYDPARGSPSALAYSPEGAFLAVGHELGSIDLYWASDGSLLHTLHGHHAKVTCLAFTAATRQIISAGQDGSVRVWGLSQG